MKRLTIFLTVVISVLSLTWSSFAANTTQKEGVSSERAENGTFTEQQFRGAYVLNQDGKVIGEIQAVNFDSQTGRIISVTFKELVKKENSPATMSRNPMFQYSDENVGGK